MLIDRSARMILSSQMACLGSQWRDMFGELRAAGFGHYSEWRMDDARKFARSRDGKVDLELYWDEYAKERLAALAGPVDVVRGVFPDGCAYRSPFMDRLRREARDLRLGAGDEHFRRFIEPSLREMFAGRYWKETAGQGDTLVRKVVEEFWRDNKFICPGELYAIDNKNYVKYLSLAMPGFDFVGDLPHRSQGFRRDIPGTPWSFLIHDNSCGGHIELGVLQYGFAVFPSVMRRKSDLRQAHFCATFRMSDIFPFWNHKFDNNSLEQFYYMMAELAESVDVIYRRLERILTR